MIFDKNTLIEEISIILDDRFDIEQLKHIAREHSPAFDSRFKEGLVTNQYPLHLRPQDVDYELIDFQPSFREIASDEADRVINGRQNTADIRRDPSIVWKRVMAEDQYPYTITVTDVHENAALEPGELDTLDVRRLDEQFDFIFDRPLWLGEQLEMIEPEYYNEVVRNILIDDGFHEDVVPMDVPHVLLITRGDTDWTKFMVEDYPIPDTASLDYVLENVGLVEYIFDHIDHTELIFHRYTTMNDRYNHYPTIPYLTERLGANIDLERLSDIITYSRRADNDDYVSKYATERAGFQIDASHVGYTINATGLKLSIDDIVDRIYPEVIKFDTVDDYLEQRFMQRLVDENWVNYEVNLNRNIDDVIAELGEETHSAGISDKDYQAEDINRQSPHYVSSGRAETSSEETTPATAGELLLGGGGDNKPVTVEDILLK